MPIDSGVALPIALGTLSLNGGARMVAKPNDEGTLIELTIEMPLGRQTLQAWFHDDSGKQLSGAFYATLAYLPN